MSTNGKSENMVDDIKEAIEETMTEVERAEISPEEMIKITKVMASVIEPLSELSPEAQTRFLDALGTMLLGVPESEMDKFNRRIAAMLPILVKLLPGFSNAAGSSWIEQPPPPSNVAVDPSEDAVVNVAGQVTDEVASSFIIALLTNGRFGKIADEIFRRTGLRVVSTFPYQPSAHSAE